MIFTALFVLTLASAVVGWFMDKDPSKLSGVLGWIAATVGFGEASNIGKRATYKKEATDVHTETVG